MSELPSHVRAFVAVTIPDVVIAQLAAFQQRLKAEFRDVSWTRPEAMHLTLQFLGAVASESLPGLTEALENATTGMKSFEVQIAGAGSFGNRVLWVGVGRGRDSLRQMAAAVVKATLPFTAVREARDFNGHVTLGRLRVPASRTASVLRSVAAPAFEGWRVDRFELIRSELSPKGARYTTLATFPLAG
jgi:2'-5' RNA ligase